MKNRIVALCIICLLSGLGLLAEEKIDSGMNWKIRREETDNSQIMSLVHPLTDIYGPRLTGSPNFKRACGWAMDQMKAWGMQNVHPEAWNFGHFGWATDRYTVRVVSPYKTNVNARVVAWTPSTKGLIRAMVIQIVPPVHASQQELADYLKSVKDKIRNKIVLIGAHRSVPIAFNPPIKRLEDSDLRVKYDPRNQAPAQEQLPWEDGDVSSPVNLPEVDEKIDDFLLAGGALVKVTEADKDHGQISVYANPAYNSSKSVPSIVIQNEDYGRISRVLADGKLVEMEIEIDNAVYSEETTSMNVVAEISGSDKREQLIMMGAHMDSWHAGTGATDNAAGVAIIMEAARILQKLEVAPMRTIRVALWGGEEQGLLGSRAYIQEHFGTFEDAKPEFSNLSAYINIDFGTGRVRGASVFGPPAAADVIRHILEPFEDLGVIGANSIKIRAFGGTDSTSFTRAGLPGISLTQDPIEYITHSWHSNLDTYERVMEEDLRQCAIVVSSAVYHLAMRDELLPRFADDSMPAPQ